MGEGTGDDEGQTSGDQQMPNLAQRSRKPFPNIGSEKTEEANGYPS